MPFFDLNIHTHTESGVDMLSINLEEFNKHILGNRFITGNEIAWYKNTQHPTERIGVILKHDAEYEAATYKRNNLNLYWLDKFQKFGLEQEARDFLENELNDENY